MTDEELEVLKLVCYFPITVEMLNHTNNPNSIPKDTNIVESESDKYAVVLDKAYNRELLGIKKIYKYQRGNPQDYIVTNAKANIEVVSFYRHILDYTEGTCISMSVNTERNKFNSTHLGPKVLDFIKNKFKEPTSLYEIKLFRDAENYFNELLERKGRFVQFISEHFSDMRIFANVFNGYDIKDFPEMRIGMLWRGVDDNNTSIFYSLKILTARIKTNRDWFPRESLFKNDLIQLIKKMYMLKQTELDFDLLIPIIFDINDVHMDENKLLRDEKKLTEAKQIRETAKLRFIDNSKSYSYLDVFKFVSEKIYEWTDLENGSFKKHKHIFSESDDYEVKLVFLIDKVTKGINYRYKYEDDLSSSYSKIEHLFIEKI
jgi:hypothetical protein